MGIKFIQGGGTIATGEGVNYVRLASLRGMLRMEKVGMKGRGGALRPKIAAEFGLSARASYDDFINAVQKKMEELAVIVQAENAAEVTK